MTVETTTRKTIQNMTISLIEYTFTFRALLSSPADIKCIRTVTATSADTDMERVTEIPAPSDATDVLKYMVDINDDGVGGTVTVMWPSTSCTITIYRDTTDLQSSDYEDYNQFPADTVENDLDRRTMRSQDQKEILERTLQYPITAASGSSLPIPAANLFLGWDADGILLENKSLPDPSTLEGASEADAVAGTDNVDYMTPLRTKQAVRTLGTLVITTTATIAALTATTIDIVAGRIAGAVTGVTQSGSDNSTKLATTAYADAAATPASGKILQVVYTMSSVLLTGSTLLPIDDSIPQNTEGNEVMTLAITPTSTANTLKVEVVCSGVSNDTGIRRMAAALFQDTTAGALGATVADSDAKDEPVSLIFTVCLKASKATEIIFKVRMGSSASGISAMNNYNDVRVFGGVCASSIVITEISG